MGELTIAGGIAAVLLLAGWAAALLATGLGFFLGFALLAFGLTLGLPAGAVYHLLLYRTLRGQGGVPARWWVAPHRLHGRLSGPQGRRVRVWFALGVVGFCGVLVGVALVGYATWRETR